MILCSVARRADARLIFPTLEGPFGNPEVLRLLIESGVAFGVCGRPEVSERSLPGATSGEWAEAELPELVDHEIVVLELR